MSRPFAAFDIDGTIIRWQLYHAIVDALGRAGHIRPEQYAAIKQARMVWKQRGHSDSFRDYENTVVRVHDEALAELTYTQFMAAVHEVITEYKEQTYTYTRDLIRSLKQQGYLLFAISGSQHEVVKLLAEFYGFDDYGGTIYEYQDGQFSGIKNVMRRERKPEYLRELVAKHDASWDDSIAVGDSGGDIPMLSAVARPIAFNPDRELFEHARAHGWNVVVERKNMVYELAPATERELEENTEKPTGKENGPYLLAQTNSR